MIRQRGSENTQAEGRDVAPSHGMPSIIRLFPLPGHCFLPGFPSPYRVFEPRYRALVEDLLKLPEHEQWLGIPMASLERNPGRTTLFPEGRVTAVGKLLHVHPLPHLQYMIVVGEGRRAVLEEISSAAPYRQARVLTAPSPKWPAAGEDQVRAALDRLLQLVAQLSPAWGEARDTVVRAMRAAPSLEDAIDLVGSLVLDAPIDRQAFLDRPSLLDRIDLLEDALLAGQTTGLFSDPSSDRRDSASD